MSAGRRSKRGAALLLVAVTVAVFLTPVRAAAQPPVDYARPVDVAPNEEAIGEGYVTPVVQRPLPRTLAWQLLDLALLAAGLALAAWIVLARRSRTLAVALTIASLVYFGFVRQGCVCPIGSIQNVAVAVVDPSYAVPVFVIGIFLLPLVAALFFGRVFCAGVCPLGAIQELVLLRPVEVPRRLDRTLGSLRWLYLAAAIGFAVLPAASRDFVICRFDPFVGLFRFAGTMPMLALGGLFLALGLVVGRPYCRWLCPYGALLSVFSRYAWKSVSITPGRELDCGLCAHACPYGAIEKMRAVRTACLACARCYGSCPVHRACAAPAATVWRDNHGGFPLAEPETGSLSGRGRPPCPLSPPEDDLGALDGLIAAALAGREEHPREALIPALQAVQQHYRWLPAEALRRIAAATGTAPAEVEGLASFYAQLRRTPVGRHVVRVCHGTACHVSGITPIMDELRRRLGVPPGADTDPARRFTLEPVACLGCCSLAPVLMIEGEVAGRLTPASACEVLTTVERA